MRKGIIIAFVIGMMAMFSTNAQKAMDKFMVQVDGLGCPFCAYGLEKKFKEFKGIKNVKIDIETGDFSFNYPAEKELSMEAVEKQVEKAGYTPITSKIERANGKIESSEDGKVALNPESLISKEVYVYGNCEQCRARIENAAKRINGVGEASWSEDTKLLSLSFDPGITSLEGVEKAVTNSGHDTKEHKAKNGVYKKLPKCCQYERVEK
ncbi:heavy-metal-associated domain-containing protein [uncultured Croceitalea sp.]|uniref:heavy-metal-associated domain-containing protein n=1 Tax=uncultured Croceitalea sp. TaxID=1798908 RepID=UPI00374FBFBE